MPREEKLSNIEIVTALREKISDIIANPPAGAVRKVVHGSISIKDSKGRILASRSQNRNAAEAPVRDSLIVYGFWKRRIQVGVDEERGTYRVPVLSDAPGYNGPIYTQAKLAENALMARIGTYVTTDYRTFLGNNKPLSQSRLRAVLGIRR